MLPIWVAAAAGFFIVIFGWMVVQDFLPEPDHHVNRQGPPIFGIVMVLLGGMLLRLSLIAGLETRISEKGPWVQFRPFRKAREFPLSDIASAEVRKKVTGNAALGVSSSGDRTNYRVGSSHELVVTLNNGTSLALDTNRASELEAWVQQWPKS